MRAGPPWGALGAAAVAGAVAASGGAFAPEARVLAGTAMALLAGFLAFDRRRPDRLEMACWAVVAWAALDVVLVGSWPLGGKEVVGAWAGAVVLLSLVRRGGDRWRDEILTILGFAGVGVAGSTVFAALGERTFRTGGVFENPNVAAAVLVPLVLLLAARGGWVAWGAAGAVAAGVALTGSRAGLLALGVGLVVTLPSRRARWVAAAAGVAGGSVLTWWRFVLHPDALAWYRPHIWWAVLRRVAMAPFLGVGPGNLPDAAGVVRLTTPTGCALHARRIMMAESTFLGYLAAVGAVGVVVAAVGAYLARGELRRAPLLRERSWWGVLTGVVVLAALHDFVEVPVVLWWWAVVLALGLGAAPGGGGNGSGGRGWWFGVTGAAVAAALVVWTIVLPAWALLRVPPGDDGRGALAMLRLEPLDDLAARRRIRFLLARAAWNREEAGEALYWSEHVVRVHAGAASSWALAGRVHAKVLRDLGMWPGTLERAREAFRRACELEPRLPWYWLDRARLERAAGDAGSAREFALRAVEVEPNCVGGWLLLGRLDLDLGRVDRARADLERAREARRCLRGRALEGYERTLAAAPAWQWRALEEALP